MTSTIVKTEFNFPKQTKLYKGKVRDVYTINNDKLIMIATDRIFSFRPCITQGGFLTKDKY